MADAALDVASAALADGGPVDAVGIANQRASTIVWDRATGEPVGPGIGWQDLRTVGDCLMLQGQGIRVAPNASATKLAFLLDMADPDRDARPVLRHGRHLGRLDAVGAARLHVTDATNAGVTGLTHVDGAELGTDASSRPCASPAGACPTIVDSTGVVGEAVGARRRTAHRRHRRRPAGLPHRPGLLRPGHGQGHVRHRRHARPVRRRRAAGVRRRAAGGGCFPIVAWRRGGGTTRGASRP